LNHDLAVIETIQKLRKKQVRSIENSKAIFLTSDNKLSRFDFNELGHRESGTICETILDRLFTTILWLKDPSAKISVKSIIAGYSKDLFIKRNIWERFYDVLHRLREKDNITDEKISSLFYHGYIKGSLMSLDDSDINRITEDFVIEELEKANKFKEEEMKKKLSEIEKTLEMNYEEKIKEKESEFLVGLDEKLVETRVIVENETIQRIKDKIKEKSIKHAKRLVKILKIVLLLFLIVSLTLTVLYSVNNNNFDHISLFGSLVTISMMVFTVIGFSFPEFWRNLERYLLYRSYNKMISEIVISKE